MVNANSCDWIEVDGRLDIELLHQAARIVTRRHPVLNARLTVGLRQGYRWVEDTAELPVDIRVERVAARLPAEVQDRLLNNVWGERLPLLHGRPFRLHVTELEAMTVLQVVTTHVFTDGYSANLVVRDLVRAYRSLHAGQPWQPAPADVADRDMTALYGWHLPKWKRLRLAVQAAGAIFREALGRVMRVGAGREPRGMTGVVMVDLGAEVLRDVRRASRVAGVSRHPFYVVAALRAIEAFNARRAIRSAGVLKIIDNFSLRRFARDDVADLYDLCSLPYSLVADGGLTDAELVRAVSAQVERLRSGDILAEIFRQRLYNAFATLMPKVLATRLVIGAVVKSNFILSNIGEVPDEIDRFGDAAIREYFSFPQLFPPGQIMMLLSSPGGSLRLICLFDRANFSRAAVTEELVGGFVRRLEACCNGFAEPSTVEPAAPEWSPEPSTPDPPTVEPSTSDPSALGSSTLEPSVLEPSPHRRADDRSGEPLAVRPALAMRSGT